MSELCVRNRQRTWDVNLGLLRRIFRALVVDLLGVCEYEVGIHLVSTPEMTRLNETYLHHAGSTDVISFDYRYLVSSGLAEGEGMAEPMSIASTKKLRGRSGPSRPTSNPDRIHGELFVCPEVARIQAKRYHATPQAEVVRYVVHGILHLLGYDDQQPADRRRMKRAEKRLLAELARRFALNELG
jgi:probable rRNA maturation factor